MMTIDTRRRIDSARDILVGKIPDPKAQVEQITTALIYKFMDDMDKESEELGGKARFFVNEYEKYSWSKLLDPRLGGYERLNLYSEALLKMPQNPNLPQLFRNILKDAFLPYRDPETLNLFLKEINGFTYDHSEKLGDAFEYLLSVLGSQGDAGQFRTPRHIIDFIGEVVDPKKDETILDPACGTAGFLIAAYKHILKQNTIHRLGDQLTPEEKTKLMQHFVGYDISPDMVRLSLTNMYLHSFPNPNVYEYDTLTSEERWDETYDVIMANPPFMSPKGGIRPHKRFSIQVNRSEVLFVDYIAEHLTTHGRAGVIVPEGIIFQSGNAYKALRKILVEKYLFAVVSLPGGIFQPYSGVKTSILLMDKQLAKKAESILFVKVENDGFDLGAQRRPIEKNDLTKALAILQQYKQALQSGEDPRTILSDSKVSTIAVLAEKSQIAKNGDYNLSGDRYKIANAIDSKYNLVELEELIEEVKARVADVNNVRVWSVSNKHGFVLSSDYFDKQVASVDISNYKIIKPGYFAYNPSRINVGSLAFNKSREVGAVSPMYVVFKLKDEQKISNEFLQSILKSERCNDSILQLAQGAVRQQLRFDDLQKIQIPLPPLEVQQKIVAELDGYHNVIDGAKQVVAHYKPEIKIDPSWKEIKLGEICEFRNGINYTKDSSGERIKILGVKDFQDNFYVPIEELDFITADGTLKENDLIQENNIVFVRSNGNQNLIGRCLLVRKVDERITHSGFTIRLILKSREFNPVFLTYLLKSEALRQRMIEGGTGANIKSLNQGILSNLIIPLPPLEVQNMIVSQLEQEQKMIEANKKLIELFEQKIKDKIAEVWGTGMTPNDDNNASSNGTLKEMLPAKHTEIEQAALDLS